MATDSTVKIKMQGVDNASAAIKAVKKQLEGLGVAANQQAATMAKGGDAIRAAMGAANGSLTGALGAVKGMSGAMTGMGVAMSTALPVAAAVAAAIWGITKAVQAHKKAQEDARKQLEAENAILLKQADAVGQLATRYKELGNYRRRMSDLQGSIEGESPIQRNKRNQELATAELGDIRNERSAVQAEMDRLALAIQDNLNKVAESSLYFVGNKAYTKYNYSEDERKTYADNAAKLMEARKKLVERYSALLNEERLQELTVKSLTVEGQRLAEEMAKARWGELLKTASTAMKQFAEAQKKVLSDEKAGLEKQLSQLSQLTGQLRLSGVYSGNSHSTNLLLDRLRGVGNDQTMLDVSTNVKTITDRLEQIERLMEQLQAL